MQQPPLDLLAGLHPGLTVDPEDQMATALAIFDHVQSRWAAHNLELANANENALRNGELAAQWARQNKDLALMIGRLVQALRRTDPTSKLPDAALDLLKRFELQGSALR